MAFCEFKNVRIAGMSAGVPSKIVSNADSLLSSDYDADAFIQTTEYLTVFVLPTYVMQQQRNS